MTTEIENENSQAAASGLTMDDLTATEKLPEVQENAIAAVQASIEESKIDQAPGDDAPYGRKADGTPKKKRGRKSGGEKSTPASTSFNFGEASTSAGISGNAPAGEIPLKSSKEAAVLASGLIETATIALISKDWKLDKEERIANQIAWERALDHYGGVELSPPLMLIGSHMQIITARAMRDSETKSRISMAILWVKSKFKRRNRDERAPEEVGQ